MDLNRVSRLLKPLGADEGRRMTGLIGGVASLIERDPVLSNLLAPDLFPAVAGVYAYYLRACREAAVAPNQNAAVADEATKTVALMEQIVACVDAADEQQPLGTIEQAIDAAMARAKTGVER